MTYNFQLLGRCNLWVCWAYDFLYFQIYDIEHRTSPALFYYTNNCHTFHRVFKRDKLPLPPYELSVDTAPRSPSAWRCYSFTIFNPVVMTRTSTYASMQALLSWRAYSHSSILSLGTYAYCSVPLRTRAGNSDGGASTMNWWLTYLRRNPVFPEKVWRMSWRLYVK